MVSAVDVTIPTDNSKSSKSAFRAQFQTIYNEITALQARSGLAGAMAFYDFVNKNDLQNAIEQLNAKSGLPQDIAFGRIAINS